MLESPGFCCKTAQEKGGNIWWHTIGIITKNKSKRGRHMFHLQVKQRSAPQTGEGAWSWNSSPSGQRMKYSSCLTERAKIGLLSQRLARQLKDRRYFPLWTLRTACASHEYEMVAQITINCQSSGFTTFYSGEVCFQVIKEWSSLLDYGKSKTALEIYAPLKIAAGKQLFRCSFFNMESSWATGCQALLYWVVFSFSFFFKKMNF